MTLPALVHHDLASAWLPCNFPLWGLPAQQRYWQEFYRTRLLLRICELQRLKLVLLPAETTLSIDEMHSRCYFGQLSEWDLVAMAIQMFEEEARRRDAMILSQQLFINDALRALAIRGAEMSERYQQVNKVCAELSAPAAQAPKPPADRVRKSQVCSSCARYEAIRRFVVVRQSCR